MLIIGHEVLAGNEALRNNQLPVNGTDSDSLILYGEIIAISPQQLILHCLNGDFNINIKSDTQIICNGMSGTWNALRPVTSNAFFEAEVQVNRKSEAMIINAQYVGAEYLIEQWTVYKGKINLKLRNPDTEEEKEIPMAFSAKVPTNPEWLIENQIIFVLYNLKGEIRAVFLPD